MNNPVLEDNTRLGKATFRAAWLQKTIDYALADIATMKASGKSDKELHRSIDDLQAHLKNSVERMNAVIAAQESAIPLPPRPSPLEKSGTPRIGASA